MRRIIISVLIATGVFAAAWMLSYMAFFRVLSYRIYDTVIQADYILKHNQDLPVYDDITIVDIDEQSISTLGQFSTWPTLFFADIVDIISSGSPKLIAFDVFFTESDSLTEFTKQRLNRDANWSKDTADKVFDRLSGDRYFGAAILRAGNVFLGMFNSPQARKTSYLPSTLYPYNVQPRHYLKLENPYPPIRELAENAYGVGFAHIEPDASGIIHSYPLFMNYQTRYYVNFSFQACLDLMQIDSINVHKNADLYSQKQRIRRLPLSPSGEFFIKYYGIERSFRYISFSDVLLGRVNPAYFQDKIILIGSSAAGLRDYRTSPLDKSYPGVELHATVMRNILSEDYIKWLSPWWTLLIVAILVLIVAVFIFRSRPQISIIVFCLISLGMVISFYLMYYFLSMTMDYSQALLPWILCYFTLMFLQYTHQIKEKKKVRFAFEHYVSKDIISQIMADTTALAIGGEKKQVCALFADIRDFSGYCENCQVSEITEFLHIYFNRVTNVVTRHQGMLDKYIGDALVALYNVPLPTADYQHNACYSAIEIVEQANQLRDEYSTHPLFAVFRIGVGIGSGEMIVGNMGSDSIFNYTAIGDKMNLSSRLESLNKYYHTSIIIDDNTYSAVNAKFLCRYLDCVSVKGKQQSNKIYELIASRDIATPLQLRLAELYDNAQLALQNSEFETAKGLFTEVAALYPEDYPTRLMLIRIDTIDRSTWDGVWHHESK
ncbi:MAG: adenylate/guanylate cyclase domain-containing protein [Candidatus Cloacimonetes bacterium HGW-Cloacimonetes-1]|jgi:adenylate cyclase|nr:MAG: adenylate/guanylate cyclase domain-containing protein [Candidatus Cloacimonetes bacterium HGW-Cloacimonetes-1]